ncbi:MAG TPA: hypothetical protein VN770_01165 [Gaiellaceae bacterium]|nr:hypothetical protein [Gaiellaceae bacterium]
MRRGVTIAAATAAALALAGVALAANGASVGVSHSPMTTSSSHSTTIHVSIPQATDPIARIAIYVPSGYSADLSAAAGTNIGTVTASAFSHDQGLVLPLSGSVVTDNPANHTSDVCSPGSNAAVWILNLTVAGESIQLPLYVNPTSGAEAALGAYKLVICLPPPDVPVGTPGRSAFGAQVLDADFTVSNVFTTPSSPGVAAWASLFTPYNPGKGTVNALGTFEAQSLVGIPATVSLKAVSVKHKTYKVTGVVREGGVAAAGVTLSLFRGGSAGSLTRVGGATTSAAGTFTFTGKLGKKPLFFQIHATAAERSTTCVSPLPATVAPAGCSGATLSAWTATSTTARLKP